MTSAPVLWFPLDAEMQAAAASALRDFRFFWRELTWEYRRIVPGLELAAVKMTFWDGEGTPAPDSGEIEYMWVDEVDCDGLRIYGSLLNAPHHLQSVEQGDEVDLPLERLTDWMYVRNGRVCGGFTVNLIRRRMSASEREAHDRAWGFDFGDPNVVELVPPGKPTGGFLGFGRKPAPPVDPEAEHPMALNVRPKYAEQLAADPSPARLVDERGWTQLHYFALGGATGIVEELLAAGADPTATTPDGRTARDLAASMGWPSIVALLDQ